MFQVAAISVATEPVPRIRAANLRDPTERTPAPPDTDDDAASPSVFEDPAAVVHIGAQARALAQRESNERRRSEAPRRGGSAGNGQLAEAARSAAQARASNVEPSEEQDERPSSTEQNPLAEAATSAAAALWGDEQGDGGEESPTEVAAEARESAPDLIEAAPRLPRDVELSAAEERKVEEMQKRDREVRQQEQSQASTGAQFTGPVHYEYRMGPDGKLYAVDGSAPIDVQPVPGDPVATLRKMEAVERAARTPSEPSLADHQTAAQAARLAQRARAELAASRYNESRDSIDVRQRDPYQAAPEPQGGDGTAPGADVDDTPRDTPRFQPEPSAAQAVADTFSDAAAESVSSAASLGAGNTAVLDAGLVDAGAAVGSAAVAADLVGSEPGSGPPALRGYQAQRPSELPGGGFQLVA
jgi:hypothetical protein